MKFLRRAALAVAVFAASLIPLQYPTLFAAGEEAAYARAQISEAYFCSQPELTYALFAIPYTYCVRVLDEEGAWYYVSYGEDYGDMRTVYGYILKNSVSLLSYTPETAYLYLTVNITYSAGVSGSLPALGEITAQGVFYGNYYSGGSGYSYVYCQGSFGYIAGATENYELCEEVLSNGEQDASSNTSGGKIAAWTALGVAAFLALTIAFFGCRRRKTGG